MSTVQCLWVQGLAQNTHRHTHIQCILYILCYPKLHESRTIHMYSWHTAMWHDWVCVYYTSRWYSVDAHTHTYSHIECVQDEMCGFVCVCLCTGVTAQMWEQSKNDNPDPQTWVWCVCICIPCVPIRSEYYVCLSMYTVCILWREDSEWQTNKG